MLDEMPVRKKSSLSRRTRVHPASKGMRAARWGILLNLFLALAKGLAGFFGNSYALLADAVESTVDIFSSLVVWTALRIAARPPDEGHPYGHGKAEPLAAIFVSLALFAAALGIAVQSVHEIFSRHNAPAPYTLIVLVVVIFLKEVIFRYVVRIGRQTESTAVKSDAWHHRSDAITSAAAFVGILVAVVGGKGFEMADGIAAFFASGIIAFNAWRLFIPALREVMDTSPPLKMKNRIFRSAAKVSGVLGFHKCFVRKMGFEYYVDLQILVNAKISVRQGHTIAHRVKDAIRSADRRIADVHIHVEPYVAP